MESTYRNTYDSKQWTESNREKQRNIARAVAVNNAGANLKPGRILEGPPTALETESFTAWVEFFTKLQIGE